MGETVTIPVEEYAALLEAAADLSDLRAYDRAQAALSQSEDELVPAEIAQRLIHGERPLRVWREYRGSAERSGVNRVQIANIEAGHATGSVATLRKLADALGLTIDDLV
jgi:transcriptional regulator with XRE-family HTH domain